VVGDGVPEQEGGGTALPSPRPPDPQTRDCPVPPGGDVDAAGAAQAEEADASPVGGISQ
jgi:hypothetical protein